MAYPVRVRRAAAPAPLRRTAEAAGAVDIVGVTTEIIRGA